VSIFSEPSLVGEHGLKVRPRAGARGHALAEWRGWRGAFRLVLGASLLASTLGVGCQGARIRPFGDDGSPAQTDLVTPDGGGADQGADGDGNRDVAGESQERDAKRDDGSPDGDSDAKPDAADAEVAKSDASSDGVSDSVPDGAKSEAGGGTGGQGGDAGGHDGPEPCTRDEQCSPT